MIRLTSITKSKALLFSIIALLAAYVFVVNEFLYLKDHPESMVRYKSMSLLLIPHVIFGLIALITGPFQFSETLRKDNLKLHRRLGKIYIISILLAAPFVILLNIYYPIAGTKETLAFQNITQALVWAFTAGMAWLAASKRQIIIHKMWAARSYGITLVFVFSRIYNPMPLFIENSDTDDFTHFLWFLVVLALIIPDVLVFSKVLFSIKKKK
jgi:hypothetical protein